MVNEFGDEPVENKTNTFGDEPIMSQGDKPTSQSLNDLSWADVPGAALSNLGSSALNTAKAVVTPVLHPLDTIAAIGNVIGGESGKLIPSIATKPGTQAADAFNNYIGGRYGSLEGFKNAVATDPVGVATDISAAFTGGETIGAKLPGIIGKTAELSGDVGRAINPLTVPSRIVSKVAPMIPGSGNAASFLKSIPGNVATKVIGDVTTGAGSKSIQNAYQAGVAGGDVGASFLGNMRGNIPWSNVVSDAKDALSNMFQERSARYRAGMQQVSNDSSVLNFDGIDKALEKITGVNSFKGKDLSPATTGVREDIFKTVADWKQEDPAEFHTPEGFDALKQRIGDIKDSQQYGTPQWTIASNAYNAVRKTIADQAPVYNKVMGDYSAASDQLSELQKELSLGKNGNPNTALRKLQSVMRDNANTSFGNRAKLADTLDANSKTPIIPALAGQALSTIIPRGLAKYGDVGMMGIAGLAHLPAALAIGAVSSPRLMGEAAYGLGAASRGLSPYAVALASKVNPVAGVAGLASYEASKPATLADYNQSPWGAVIPSYMKP